MMANNARRSCGTCWSALGLGLYPQMAAALGRVERFTAIGKARSCRLSSSRPWRVVLSVPLAIRSGTSDMLAGRWAMPRHIFSARGPPWTRPTCRREPPARWRTWRGRSCWGYRWMVELFDAPRPAGGGARRARRGSTRAGDRRRAWRYWGPSSSVSPAPRSTIGTRRWPGAAPTRLVSSRRRELPPRALQPCPKTCPACRIGGGVLH